MKPPHYLLCYGASYPPTGLAPVSHRYQRCASLSTLWRSLEMVGHLGAAPSISRRSERRGLLSSSYPDTSCPFKMDAHPGLAPGKSVLRTDGSTILPCARLKMGRPTGAAPAQRSSQDRMLAVTSRPPFEIGSSGRRCPGMVRI